jgi:hypothetical protein
VTLSHFPTSLISRTGWQAQFCITRIVYLMHPIQHLLSHPPDRPLSAILREMCPSRRPQESKKIRIYTTLSLLSIGLPKAISEDMSCAIIVGHPKPRRGERLIRIHRHRHGWRCDHPVAFHRHSDSARRSLLIRARLNLALALKIEWPSIDPLFVSWISYPIC